MRVGRRGLWLMLVARTVSAQCDVPRTQVPADVPPTVAQAVAALYSARPEERMAGACALGEARAQVAAPFLLGLLHDHGATHERKLFLWQPPDSPYGPILTSPGREAAKALVKLGPAVLPAVRALAADAKRPAPLRANACYILGELRDGEALPVLTANLGEIDALLALGKLADARAIPALLTVLPDGWRGYLAARALLAIGQPAVAPLLAALEEPAQRARRAPAAELLGRLRATVAVPALARATADPEAAVRLAALEALTALAAPAPEAFRAALGDADWRCRSAALKGLLAVGAPVAAPVLTPLLADPDLTVRGHAARAVAALAPTGAPPAVRPLLADPEPFVRVSALRALAALGDRESGPTVLALLDDPDDRVRDAALTALGPLGEQRAAERLLALLRGTDEGLRTRASAALGELGARALPALVAALRQPRDGQWTFLNAVADALGQVGSAEAAAAVVPLLTGQPWMTEVAAGRALAKMGAPGTEALLSAATRGVWRAVWPLQDNPDPRVADALIAATRGGPATRQAAAEVLGKRKERRAVPALIGLLGDQDARTAANAQAALEAIGGQAFGRDAARWTAWWAAQRGKD